MKKIIGQFKFDTDTDRCWWVKNGEDNEISKDSKGRGAIAYQHYYILEKETNPAHWVNWHQTFSKGKLWIRSWYKKSVLKDGEEIINHYKLKVEKTENPALITFTEMDEVIKVFDEKKQKDVWKFKHEDKKKDEKVKTLTKQVKDLEKDKELKKTIDDLNNL